MNGRRKKSAKIKGHKKGKSLNCASGSRSVAYKALQDENIPPKVDNRMLMERFLKQTLERNPHELDASLSSKQYSSQDVTQSSVELTRARSSLLFNSKQYTPKARLLEESFFLDGKSPSAFLEKQMPLFPTSDKGSDIHKWLDGVASETLRKDGSYSNSGTSPELTPEQTLLHATGLSSVSPEPEATSHPSSGISSGQLCPKMISDDNLRWDPGISLIEPPLHSPGLSNSLGHGSDEPHRDDSAFGDSEFDNAYISGPLDAPLLHTTLATETSHDGLSVIQDPTISVINSSRTAHINTRQEIDSEVASTSDQEGIDEVSDKFTQP